MNDVCNNKDLLDLIKYIIITFKYIIPIILIIIGILKLIIINKKTKALKRFIKYVLIGIIVFFITYCVENMLKNKYECILCNMNNNCEIKEKIDNGNQEKEELENEKPEINESLKKEEMIDSESKNNETIGKEPIDNVNQNEITDTVKYIDGILIVNKTYSLPEDYAPVTANGYNWCNECLTNETLNAFKEMKADASSLGLNIYISSGYRSYSYQQGLYNNYVSRDGKNAADTYSARPGHSEHQTGLAFDLNTIDDSFADTAEGKWVGENCYKYGLILRYPKGKEHLTGYQYESWHLRYVGKELAHKLYNNGNWITLEEYFNITSKYE